MAATMTFAEANQEAKKRWGAEGLARLNQKAPEDPGWCVVDGKQKEWRCVVGVLRMGAWFSTQGLGATWEDAFARADGKAPVCRECAQRAYFRDEEHDLSCSRGPRLESPNIAQVFLESHRWVRTLHQLPPNKEKPEYQGAHCILWQDPNSKFGTLHGARGAIEEALRELRRNDAGSEQSRADVLMALAHAFPVRDVGEHLRLCGWECSQTRTGVRWRYKDGKRQVRRHVAVEVEAKKYEKIYEPFMAEALRAGERGQG